METYLDVAFDRREYFVLFLNKKKCYLSMQSKNSLQISKLRLKRDFIICLSPKKYKVIEPILLRVGICVFKKKIIPHSSVQEIYYLFCYIYEATLYFHAKSQIIFILRHGKFHKRILNFHSVKFYFQEILLFILNMESVFNKNKTKHTYAYSCLPQL